MTMRFFLNIFASFPKMMIEFLFNLFQKSIKNFIKWFEYFLKAFEGLKNMIICEKVVSVDKCIQS